MTTLRGSAPLVLALVLPLGAAGCVKQLAAEVPRAATPAVIDGGLRAMDDPENKRRLEHILASPEIKVIQQELVAAVLDGSLAALDERERVDRIGDVTSRYAASLLRGFSKEMAPATASMTRGVLGGMMTEDNQRQMQRMVGSLVQASVDPVMKSLSNAELPSSISAAMTRELGPAFQQVLRDNLGPGVAQALGSEEVKRALGATAHVLGRELVLGANEGLAKVQENKAPQDSSLIGSLGSLAHTGANAATILLLALGLAVIALTGWIAKLLVQTRRYRTENEQRVETTRVLSEAIRAAEDKPWSGELLAALEDRFRNDEEAMLRIRASRRKAERPRASAPSAMNGAH